MAMAGTAFTATGENLSSDGCGIVWEVQATAPPPYEVYNMAHSDVLISEIPKKKAPVVRNPSDIVASAKTLAAFRGSTSVPAANPQSGTDPMQAADPWATYVPITKQPRLSSSASASGAPNLEVMNATVDRKVAAAMAQVDRKLADVDLHMSGPLDSRV